MKDIESSCGGRGCSVERITLPKDKKVEKVYSTKSLGRILIVKYSILIYG